MLLEGRLREDGGCALGRAPRRGCAGRPPGSPAVSYEEGGPAEGTAALHLRWHRRPVHCSLTRPRPPAPPAGASGSPPQGQGLLSGQGLTRIHKPLWDVGVLASELEPGTECGPSNRTDEGGGPACMPACCWGRPTPGLQPEPLANPGGCKGLAVVAPPGTGLEGRSSSRAQQGAAQATVGAPMAAPPPLRAAHLLTLLPQALTPISEPASWSPARGACPSDFTWAQGPHQPCVGKVLAALLPASTMTANCRCLPWPDSPDFRAWAPQNTTPASPRKASPSRRVR